MFSDALSADEQFKQNQPRPIPDQPRIGEIVLVLHGDDAKLYPALVLEADILDTTAPLAWQLHLQVFRPRANYWVRSDEGTGPNQYRRSL